MASVRWAFCTKKWKPNKLEWLSGLCCAQEEERIRIMKFVFKRDAKSALIGRLMLRKVIAEQLGIPYNDIILGRTDKGKPYLTNKTKSEYFFNVSHQGDYVVLAAEPSSRVGVDVMKTEIKGSQSINDFFHTMRRQFTPYEWQVIKTQPTERKQLQMFLRHWCLKESYVKALGVGISFPKKLQSIEFRISGQSQELSTQIVATDTQIYLENERLDSWRFEECKLDGEHQVSVAIEFSSKKDTTEFKSNNFTILSTQDLIPTNSGCIIDQQIWSDFQLKKD